MTVRNIPVGQRGIPTSINPTVASVYGGLCNSVRFVGLAHHVLPTTNIGGPDARREFPRSSKRRSILCHWLLNHHHEPAFAEATVGCETYHPRMRLGSSHFCVRLFYDVRDSAASTPPTSHTFLPFKSRRFKTGSRAVKGPSSSSSVRQRTYISILASRSSA